MQIKYPKQLQKKELLSVKFNQLSFRPSANRGWFFLAAAGNASAGKEGAWYAIYSFYGRTKTAG